MISKSKYYINSQLDSKVWDSTKYNAFVII